MTIIKTTFDINNPPAMSDEALARLDAIKDEDIDFSDIPELDDEFFRKAKRINHFSGEKTRVTMRLDTDVLEWLKSQGKGYQTRANMILRAAMEHHPE
jgi:uncharacterized protein (DUF4415 family)